MTTSNPALIVIDVQNGIDDSDYWGGNRNNPEAEENIQKLITGWREKKLPIFFVRHNSVLQESPFRPGQSGNDFKSFIVPGNDEVIITKSTASAFVNTSLRDELTARKIQEVVVVGFVTNNSVEATARMAGDLGYKTYVVSDATACFDKVGYNNVGFAAELIHMVSLSNLNEEYATILSSDELKRLIG